MTTGVTETADGDVTIVGTLHVSEESTRKVRETIEDVTPDVVGIELDDNRFYKVNDTLIASGVVKDELEPVEALLAYAQWVQQKQMFGSVDGIVPQGQADMLPAAQTAVESGAEVRFVDQHIEETTSEIWDRLSPSAWLDEFLDQPIRDQVRDVVEYVRDVSEVFAEQVGSDKDFETPQEALKDRVEEMEQMDTEEAEEMTDTVETVAPPVHDVILEQRNQAIAGHAQWLRNNGYDNIVLVVGRAHAEGVRKLIDNHERIDEEFIQEPTELDSSEVPESVDA